MQYYLAPLEGVTGYIYRRAYHTFFPDFDKYFLPFIAPHTKRSFNAREKNDLLPEHNEGMYVVPQVLTNSSEDFLRIAGELEQFGYQEINLNLGCPSGTVAAKGRGSGFLAEPKILDRFLAEVFEQITIRVSLKTRVGIESTADWPELLEIYNKYPLEELIIHPRIQKDFYKYSPRMETYDYAAAHSTNTLCYNGDLFTAADEKQFEIAYPQTKLTMYGRGVITNPALLSEIKHGEKLSRDKLWQFHDKLYEDYTNVMSGGKNVLFKMKEVWAYMLANFEDAQAYEKKLRKAQNTAEYEAVVRQLFLNCELKK